MNRIVLYIFLIGAIGFGLWSCAKVSGQGHLRMVMTGNVHGQLDPCG